MEASEIREYFFSFIENFTESSSELKNNINSTLALVSIWILYIVLNKYLPTYMSKVASKTKTLWDDILVEKRFLHHIALLIPSFFLLLLSPHLYTAYEIAHNWIVIGSNLILTITIYLSIHSFFNSVLLISEEAPSLKDKPIKGYIQIIQIVGILITGIFCLAIIFQKPLIYFFSGIGATAALLLLVFKDSILGFVTSIQLTANQMVKKGDWITMNKYKADGTVLDISLNTVKVQNWDNTISTIPTYAMISDSFQNWNGMQASGARRIKRSIYIDVSTIKMCTEDELTAISQIPLLEEYIKEKSEEIADYNTKNSYGRSYTRQLTNIGLFRVYIEEYLKKHDSIRKDLTFLIRQLQPTETGLPIEVYVFTTTTVWTEYEAIQSDIFDHLLAIVSTFNLKVFQNPSEIKIS